ncbi:V protein [Sosuga virus]|uniref:V protein n=1 Tax=Sosuga virus TaxID=1452514 RepID=W5S5N4_9MONO|nr:V protein [Sosuga virus]AHH02036.1 V protein [Sosuga virus]
MDQPPSDAEISAWIERGLATARHFAPGPVTSQSSLGKSTIKKGNTKQLVDSAEFTAATLAPAGGLQGSMPCSIPAGQSKAGQGARPKVKKAAQTRATPTKPDAPTIEPVYEDIVSTPGRDKAQVQLPSPKLSAKDKLLSAPPLQQHSNIPTGPEGQNFKRGLSSGSAASIRRNPNPGHRREFDLVWGGGSFTMREWCNPTCSPITPIPRRHHCRCGQCPRVCKQCEGDYQVLEGDGEQDEPAGVEN